MLQNQINDDIKAAMLSKDSAALNVLRQLKNAISNFALSGGNINTQLSDLEVLGLIRKQIKQREDSIALFQQGGRLELASKEIAEIAILERYLPKALSDEEVDAIIQAIIAESGATTKKQMGQVMKLALEKCSGRVDNKTLSSKIGAKLS